MRLLAGLLVLTLIVSETQVTSVFAEAGTEADSGQEITGDASDAPEQDNGGSGTDGVVTGDDADSGSPVDETDGASNGSESSTDGLNGSESSADGLNGSESNADGLNGSESNADGLNGSESSADGLNGSESSADENNADENNGGTTVRDTENGQEPEMILGDVPVPINLTTEPVLAEGLTYTGLAQSLLQTSGEAAEGETLEYKVTKTEGSGDSGSPADWAATEPTATDAGTYQVFYRVNGADETDLGSVIIAKADSSVASEPAAKSGLTYNGDLQTLVEAGTASSGSAMVYSLTGSEYSESIPTGTNAGDYTVYYKAQGDANHNDSTVGQVEVKIAKAAPTVTAPTPPKDLTYTGAEQPLLKDESKGSAAGVKAESLTLQYSLDDSRYSADIPKGTDAEVYTVYYKVQNDNYEDARGSVTVTIAKADAAAESAPAAQDLTYNTAEQALVAEGSATGGTMQYALKTSDSEEPNEGDWSDVVPKAKDAGDYYVYYRVKGDENHNDTASQNVKVTIKKATPNVTAPTAAANLKYKNEEQSLLTAAGSTTGGTLKYSVTEGTDSSAPGDEGGWVESIDTLKKQAVGAYKVWYKVVGDSNYEDAAAAYVTVTIAKATPGVTAPTAKTDLKYTGAALNLLESAGSTTGGTLKYSVTDDTVSAAPSGDGEWTTDTASLTKVDAGKYKVWYKVVGNDNYEDAAAASVTVTIAKATPIVTAPTAKTDLKYTGAALNLLESAGSTTGGTLKYSVTDDTVLAAPSGDDEWNTDITSLTKINAGKYKVWYKVVGNADYEDAAAASVTVTIAKADAVAASAPTAQDLTYNTAEQALVAEGSATGGTMQYALKTSDSEEPNEGDWSDVVPKAKDAGDYYVYYRVKGDENHNNTDPQNVKVTIEKATPDVTAPTKRSLTYTGSSQKLVTEGSTTGGTLWYCVTGTGDPKPEAGTGSWTTDVPEETEAGKYNVYYRVQGDSNYKDVDVAGPVEVSIEHASLAGDYTAPTGMTGLIYDGSSQALVTAGTAPEGCTMEYRMETADQEAAGLKLFSIIREMLGAAGGAGWSTDVPVAEDAGVYRVYWRIDGGVDYDDIEGTEPIEVSIGKAESALTTAPEAAEGLTYDGEPQALLSSEGTASGGVMQYSLQEDGGYSESIPAETDAGSYTVYYKVKGDKNHTDTTAASVSVAIAKAAPSYTAPAGKNSLIYTGAAQALVTEGSAAGGSLMYRMGADGAWSSSIPTATDVGTYDVYYYVEGDSNHESTDSVKLTVKLAKGQARIVTLPTAKELIYTGSAQTLVTPGQTFLGIVLYSLEKEGEYSTEIPVGTEAGTYTVWYKVEGNENYDGTAPMSVTVEIKEKVNEALPGTVPEETGPQESSGAGQALSQATAALNAQTAAQQTAQQSTTQQATTQQTSETQVIRAEAQLPEAEIEAAGPARSEEQTEAAESAGPEGQTEAAEPAGPETQTEETAEPESSTTEQPALPAQQSGEARNVAAQIQEDGRIAVTDDMLTEGTIATGTISTAQSATTIFQVGAGTVTVMVDSGGYEYAAGVADTASVANIVLTNEQIAAVGRGESIGIRIDVKDISEQVPQEEKDVIESGLANETANTSGQEMVLGQYIDISMFVKVGESDWDAVTDTGEPIDVVIEVPAGMRGEDREFYIARSHEGVYTLLQDLDDDPDTVTIRTELFSTYAIAYTMAGGAAGSKCSLCHICPTFLGVCCFVWLAVILAVGIVAAILLVSRKRKEKAE